MDFLEEELEEILNIFRDESEEHIQNLNKNLLKLESNPDNGEAITELFREAHSIKGAARMIGLTDIQTLAHKIEDIFGLAREGQMRFTPKIVDILCKAVDCISSIVEESIKSRGQSHSSEVDVMMTRLLEIEEEINMDFQENTQENPKSSPRKPEDPPEIITAFCLSTVPLIPQIRETISRLKISTIDTSAINELHQLIEKVDNQAQTLSVYELKEPVQDIKIKIDGVTKGSGMLLDVEVEEIEETFNKFTYQFDKMLETVDFSTVELSAAELPEEESSIEIPESLLIPDADNSTSDTEFISNNLILLSDNTPASLTTLKNMANKLGAYSNSVQNQEIKQIIDKIQEIVIFTCETRSYATQDVALVIKESFDSVVKIFEKGLAGSAEDPNLIFQRLSILQQMLKLSSQDEMNIQEPEFQQEETPKVDFSPTTQNTEILHKIEPSSASQQEIPKAGEDTTIKTLRVDTRKLDQLVSQVGELIIAKIKAKEHLSEIEKINRSIEDWYREWNKAKQILKYLDKKPVKASELPAGTSIYSQNKNINTFFEESSSRLATFMNQMNLLYRIIQEDDARLDLIVNELEEKIKSVRVLPLATIFHMFPRMVRDIAREKNKDIELIISGSETSVDKKIIEEIKSPLMHIIRNAIDHGIETPEERIKRGKNPTGKIILSAYHLENSVSIEIIDDGRGIDLERIKQKVVQKGILTPSELQAMNDTQIMNIIFWPGFSTGESITDISGRGVGLDVVHTKITQLNGKVNIKSTFGEGCKVSVQLPITMATVKSFLVQIQNQTYSIPTSAIKTALLVNPNEIFYKEGKETIIVDNKTVPVCKLSRVLELPDNDTSPKKIVVIVIQAEDVEVGFIIDKLLGDQEILHKNLTPPLLRVKNVAGVTTLASGELCLILNVNDLVKSAYSTFGMSKKQLIIDKENTTAVVKKNILVVDDSVTTRILERNILKAAGYNVTVAINGLDALTKLVSDQFDLVVSDVEMPEINGFELAERIRHDDKFKKLPVILVTSLASEADRKKGLAMGASAYITKGDFDQEELLSTVRKLLNG